MQPSHHTITAHALVILTEITLCPKIGVTFSSNSRSLKLSKKYPRVSRKRRGSIINTPWISVFIISISYLIIYSYTYSRNASGNLQRPCRRLTVTKYPFALLSPAWSMKAGAVLSCGISPCYSKSPYHRGGRKPALRAYHRHNRKRQ